MIVKEFLTKWGFDIETDKLDSVDSRLKGIQDRLDLMLASELVHKITHMVEEFGNWAEQLHAVAIGAGLSVEELQKLQYAAQQSGVEAEELGMSMRRLSLAIYQAKKGSEESLTTFKHLGFEPDQVKGFKTSEQALLAISDRFSRMKDPIEKAALAQQVFGRGSQHMVAFLSEGSKAIRSQLSLAEDLGLVLGEHQVEALQRSENAFKNLHGLMRAIGATIAAELAPSFVFLINDLIKLFQANRDVIQQSIKQWFFDFTYALGFCYAALKFVVEKVVDFGHSLGFSTDQMVRIAGWVGVGAALMIAFGLAVKGVSFVVGILSSALEVFGVVLGLVDGALTLLVSPLAIALTSTAALVVAIHDLYALLTGGKTWSGGFIEWAKSLDVVKGGLSGINSVMEKIGFGLSPGLNQKLAFAGAGDQTGSAQNRSSDVPGLLSSVANSTSVAGNNSYEVSAPITVNVPPGSNPQEVGKSVKEGVSEHLDRVFRETQRSVRSPVAY